MVLCGKLYFFCDKAGSMVGWFVLCGCFFGVCFRSCGCAHTVFDCQVLAIIQSDHVLGFFFMFKLLHVFLFFCVVLPDVLYLDTFMAGCIAGCVASDACV